MSKALVLLSGGLDSAYALHIACSKHDHVLALTLDYGQNFREREIAAAKILAERYRAESIVVDLPFLNTGSAHPFFGNERPPELNAEQLDDLAITQSSAQIVWVPNRNGVFINVAAALAEARGAEAVYVGFNREEAATFADNSKEYAAAATHALSFSTRNAVKVAAPAVEMSKVEIVAELKKAGFDFALLWSCYRNQLQMCGRCESCQRLVRALRANQCEDVMNKIFNKNLLG